MNRPVTALAPDADAATSVPQPSAAAATPGPDASRGRLSRERAAALAFAGYLLLGTAYLVHIQLRGRFFSADEWQAVADPHLGEMGTLFEEHFQHWITVPLLVFRGLFELFGVRTYLPYLAVALAVHLAVVVLLRVLMRRSGVGPWVATIMAGTLVVFGPGSQNVVWAYQITMTGAVLFGLAQLLLADHAGPAGWRDGAALGAGLLGLMCSGIALAMVVVVGVALLLRRGWWAAARQTVPLVAVFAAWWLWQRPSGNVPFPARLADLPSWLWAAYTAGVEGLAHWWLSGVLLVAMTLTGVVLAARAMTFTEFRRTFSLPAGTAAGALFLPLLIFPSRAGLGSWAAGSSRYVYVYSLLLAPVVALALSVLIRRWRQAAVLLAVPLLAVPANYTFDNGYFGPPLFARIRSMTDALARSPALATAPADLVPDPAYWLGHPGMTVGWLRQALADGSVVPATDPVPAALAAEADLRLSLRQSTQPAPASCRQIPGGGTAGMELAPGSAISFLRDPRTTLIVMPLELRAATPSGPAVATYHSGEGNTLTWLGRSTTPARLTAPDGQPWWLCRPPG